MMPAEFAPIASHIWQSTLFAAVAVLLTLALRRNQARVRYAILLAASYKFLLPFSWLVSLGRKFEWRTVSAALPHAVSTVTDVISAPTFLMPTVTAKTAPDHLALLPMVIWLMWGCGTLIIVAGWMREWLRIRAVVRAATPLPFSLPIPVVSIRARLEPGVFGILRPVLLLPEDVAQKLSPAQLRVVLAHELCHVRRRDNLAAALHMLVEALFWFHPLVWWLDHRMVDERERACDEEVLRIGGAPVAYAETILAVCKSYVESPIACMSGISGSDLKKRVVNVMANRRIENLGPARKALLSALGIAAIVVPVAFGIVNAPSLHAQSAMAGTQVDNRPSFEVASIKRDSQDASGKMFFRMGPPPGDVSHWSSVNVSAKQLVGITYGVRNFQIEGGPGWIDSERFDVDAKVDDSVAAQLERFPIEQQEAQMALMLRPLLADRFKLEITRGTKEGTVLALLIAKGGSKLKPASPEPQASVNLHAPAPPVAGRAGTPPPGQPLIMMNGGTGLVTMAANGVPIADLVNQLSERLGQQVVDRTGLKGTYRYRLQFAIQGGLGPDGVALPAAAEASQIRSSAASVFTALQEQLGLKLESTKGKIETITINHIEEPTPN